MSTDARIRRLEAELESLRRSTRIALEESWQEVERLESENAYREEKILGLQAQLASYMDKEAEEDNYMRGDSTSASSTQSQSTSPVSPEGKTDIVTIPSDECSLEHRVEINFPSQNPVRALLAGTRPASMRSLVGIGSRQGSSRSIGSGFMNPTLSPMSSIRTGARSCNVAISPLQRCPAGESATQDSEKFNASERSLESFPISSLKSQIRSGLKKCGSFKVKSGSKEKSSEPTEMEKALLRQLEYLQEEKNLDVQDLELKIEQRDAVIEALEAKVSAQEATIEELHEKIAELRRRRSRGSSHHS